MTSVNPSAIFQLVPVSHREPTSRIRRQHHDSAVVGQKR